MQYRVRLVSMVRGSPYRLCACTSTFISTWYPFGSGYQNVGHRKGSAPPAARVDVWSTSVTMANPPQFHSLLVGALHWLQCFPLHFFTVF